MFTLHLQDYSIYIGEINEQLSQFIRAGNYTKIAILTDENVKKHCLDLLPAGVKRDAVILEIQAGEEFKSIDTCEKVWQQMMQAVLDRKSLLINLGGGVIGDLGGFCAATYLRGIDFIQMPATLLAMADASIGGKLGVDFNYVKNSIGVFQNPAAVFMNTQFLNSLPKSEILSGFAEVFKHALIYDVKLWEDLQSLQSVENANWDELLPRSLNVKKRFVEDDPLEKNIRKALNFGHTVGHALESFALQSNGPLKHGEAVAMGMICESWLSWKMAGLSQTELDSICNFILRFYKKCPLETQDYPFLIELMLKDKKNRGGKINVTLISPIGAFHIDNILDEALIIESLDYLRSLNF